MNKYKCESHKLDFICSDCIRAGIARHDAMLAFVKNVSEWSIPLAIDARELLKEIGE